MSLYSNNKKLSQTMMRARVFFQLCTVSTLIGGVYWRAYKGQLEVPMGTVTQDKRIWMTDGPFAKGSEEELPALAAENDMGQQNQSRQQMR
jgi:hypothetical protein